MNKNFPKFLAILVVSVCFSIVFANAWADTVDTSATVTANNTPNAPTLVSPINGSLTSDNTPTLSAHYSDNDVGDTGTTNYRISSSSLNDCKNNISIADSGTSIETITNNEDTNYTPLSSIGSDGVYYWCAQNDDGINTSLWTEMGSFILDTAPPVVSYGTVVLPSAPALKPEPEPEPEPESKAESESQKGVAPEEIVLPKSISESIIEISKKIQEVSKEISEKIPEIIRPIIPEFLKSKLPKIEIKEIPIEELISKQIPDVFSGKWDLLPKSIESFVLDPLPKEIRKLAQKFPELGETLKQVGIKKITDIQKLKTIKLTLPGLTERAGLPIAEIQPGKFALPKGVPVAKLSSLVKQQLPTEIVFAKTGGGLIDFNIALSVNEKGEPQQKIVTIVGKPLQLVVKQDKQVKSIKGYIIFKARKIKPEKYNIQYEFETPDFNLQDMTASLVFIEPNFVEPVKDANYISIEGSSFESLDSNFEETRLVLLEFEYTDPDNDGIYTAEIQAPLVEGEYEIITVMEFEDPELDKEEIKLVTLIDPEGYIYEKDGDKETRIPGAIVSIYWLNPETKQYELWPAKEYQQENPQITTSTGAYSFLVPQGSYYLKVVAPGYLVYDGKPFQVREGSGVHFYIELKTKYWFLKMIDWKTGLLILIIILLLYNFYRDKIREKLLRYKYRP